MGSRLPGDVTAPHREDGGDQTATAAGAPRDGNIESSPVAQRQERAAERLLEDERLRGVLTDDEFQPLLDWALAASDGLADGTVGLSDDEAAGVMDAGLGQVRDVVQAAGGAVSAMLEAGTSGRNAELARLPGLVAPPLVPEERIAEARARLSSELEPIVGNPDLTGVDLAAALAVALRTLSQTADQKDETLA